MTKTDPAPADGDPPAGGTSGRRKRTPEEVARLLAPARIIDKINRRRRGDA